MNNNNNAIEIPCITTVSSGAIPVIIMLCRTAKIGEIVNQMAYIGMKIEPKSHQGCSLKA